MTGEIRGVSLETFREPIQSALRTYQKITRGRVHFDVPGAANLELTPDAPTSAGSTTNVLYSGDTVAKLQVIAFAPLEANGNEKAYKLKDVDTDEYPNENQYVPQSRRGIHAEAHLTFASFVLTGKKAGEIIKLAGSYSLLGLHNGKVVKAAGLGQNEDENARTIKGEADSLPGPTVTFSTGYKKGAKKNQMRFGDPRAIHNPWQNVVQVCGLIALANTARRYQEIFRLLNAQTPQLWTHNSAAASQPSVIPAEIG